MTEPKRIQGKFYPLKNSEWLDNIAKLTHAELKVLYYIRSLDPHNDGIDITPAKIARALSTEKQKMHRSTVGRALKKLDREGLIHMELINVRVRVNPGGILAKKIETQETSEEKSIKNKLIKLEIEEKKEVLSPHNNVVATQHEVRPHNTECDHTTSSATTQHTEAETQTGQDFQTSKTLKTFKTFSEAGERERFFNFCKRQADKLPQEVVMIRSWIDAHFEELLEMYKEATGQIEIQEEEKCSAGANSGEELIQAALESGEIEDYDMGCKSVRYPNTKWWTDLEDFLASKREPSPEAETPEAETPEAKEQAPEESQPESEAETPEAEEITETPKAQDEFFVPDFRLKTLNRSAQRIIDEALKSGELEEYDQVNGMVKIKGNRWWTNTNDFLKAKRQGEKG